MKAKCIYCEGKLHLVGSDGFYTECQDCYATGPLCHTKKQAKRDAKRVWDGRQVGLRLALRTSISSPPPTIEEIVADHPPVEIPFEGETMEERAARLLEEGRQAEARAAVERTRTHGESCPCVICDRNALERFKERQEEGRQMEKHAEATSKGLDRLRSEAQNFPPAVKAAGDKLVKDMIEEAGTHHAVCSCISSKLAMETRKERQDGDTAS